MSGTARSTLGVLLHSEDVLLDLDVHDRRAFFRAIGDHMEIVHGMPRDWVALCLERRESAGSTALGQGFAIPHARVVELDRIHALYVRLATPIDLDAPDRLPVTDALVLLVPAPACPEHLSLLAEATRLFSDGTFRRGLRNARDAADVLARFRESDVDRHGDAATRARRAGHAD